MYICQHFLQPYISYKTTKLYSILISVFTLFITIKIIIICFNIPHFQLLFLCVVISFHEVRKKFVFPLTKGHVDRSSIFTSVIQEKYPTYNICPNFRVGTKNCVSRNTGIFFALVNISVDENML